MLLILNGTDFDGDDFLHTKKITRFVIDAEEQKGQTQEDGEYV